jgi:DNA mismatch repair protein MutL
MGRIQPLPSHLIDQIAAGEVVERPASVVKELVENALDAGAKRIRIEVRDGGCAWICISDDGYGMSPADATLALQRHATSKIATVDDLSDIHTFGFRGEALPSIASVSNFRLRTREAASEAGFEIVVEAGEIKEERACAATPGTRIEVADLFASIPARRKFLKRSATEWGHILDWLVRVALVHPDVHFELRREQKKPLVWPATPDPLARVATVLSEDEASALVPVDGCEGELRLSGFASAPAFHRATAAGVYLFVNGRPVRDRLLRHAVLQIYRDLLPRGRFPTVLLFLEVPADAVDVNVHPAKWEVRFADPQAVHQLVRHALRNSVQGRDYLPQAPATTLAGGYSAFIPARGDRIAEPTTSDWVFAAQERAGEDEASAHGTPAPLQASRVRFSEYRLLGQLLATYLVLEGKDALLLIDQHAAHERVLYERLRARWLEGGVERQPLLLPVSVELDLARVGALIEHNSFVEAMGFEIEAFGEDAVMVRALPALLAGREPDELVRSLADEICESNELGAQLEPGSRVMEGIDKIFASLACHAARRKGDVLNVEEQKALLSALDEIPWAPTCPHGRTVAVPMEVPEIERRFARR